MPTTNSISTQEGTKVPGRRAVPQPDGVSDAAGFIALMRRLQRWSGLSLAELEARMGSAHVLLPEGLAGMLGGSALPRREVVSAFISACGCVPEVQADWMRAYARVSGTSPAPSPAPSAEAAAFTPRPSREAPQEEPEVPEKRSRPRHRKSAGKRRHQRTRRSLSPLAAAPAFVTVLVIAVAMLTGTGDDSGKPEGKQDGKRPTATPPGNGWYGMQTETSTSVGDCLSIFPDNEFAPTLSQEQCDEEDPLQRFWLEPDAGGVYAIKAYTVKEQLWCLTLDAPNDGARLHLKACDEASKWQRFTLQATEPPSSGKARDKTSQPSPLFALRAAETRDKGMCVGIDSSNTGTVQAVHTACTKAGVWGYSFIPTVSPE
jgi:hypothetical protein